MVRSGLCGRAGLSIGSADRSSHQPLARAIVRSHIVCWKNSPLSRFWSNLEEEARPGGGTADPTWGDNFESCFKGQSSKLERLFCHVSVKRDIRALSFERAFEYVTPGGIGCGMKKCLDEGLARINLCPSNILHKLELYPGATWSKKVTNTPID